MEVHYRRSHSLLPGPSRPVPAQQQLRGRRLSELRVHKEREIRRRLRAADLQGHSHHEAESRQELPASLHVNVRECAAARQRDEALDFHGHHGHRCEITTTTIVLAVDLVPTCLLYTSDAADDC